MTPPQILTFTSRFANNAVILVDLLAESDLQTAQRLSEELDPLRLSDGSHYCRYRKISSAQQLRSLLVWVEEQCRLGLRPIIHFEAHGSQNDGLMIGGEGEWIGWGEIAAQLLQINTIAENNLGVVMASCFGFYAIKPITIKKPAPFYFLIGATSTVAAGIIQDRMGRFYKKLFDQRSLDDAMTEVGEEFRQFHAELFFCISFGKYIKQCCVGAGASRRVERLVSDAFASGVYRSRDNLRALRRSAKTFVKSSDRQRATFYRVARYFLHGKVSMDFEEFERFVKRADP
jgi:hypothetical protein